MTQNATQAKKSRYFTVGVSFRLSSYYSLYNSSKQIRKRKPNVSHWLWELLQTPKNRKMIQFTDEKMGEFRIMDQKTLANLWGTRNGRINARMNYKDLARTMRYHYKKSKGQELQAVNR